MNEKDFKRLLTAYLDGEITPEETVQLKNAVEEIPAYRHQFQDEVRMHTLLREVVSEKIEEKKITGTNSKKPKKAHRPKPILAYVFSAVAALAITGALFGFYLVSIEPKSIGVCVQIPIEGEHHVLRGEQELSLHKDMELFENDVVVSSGSSGTLIMLKDGSMVSVEKDAKFDLFRDGVPVALKRGEILLEVSERKEGEVPFRVKTLDSTLTVLGTIFSVNARPNGYTKLSVFEGNVELARLNDSKKVEVKANEYVLSSDQNLISKAIEETKEVESEVVNILPIADLYVEGRKTFNNSHLRIRKNERTVYFKFKVEDADNVKKAILYLKQTIDPGSGTISFHLGSHSNWTEKNFDVKNAPQAIQLISKRTGAVSGGKVIEIDLSKGIKGNGVYTIIMSLNKGEAHDIWFHSRESSNPPLLKIFK